MLTLLFSPTRHPHAGNLPLVRQLAETNPAQAELAVHGPRPATQVAAGLGRVLNFGLRLALAILDLLATGFSFPNHGVKNIVYRRPNLHVGTATPSYFNSSRDSSFECDEHTNAMFIPWTRVYLSGLSSGNTSCSFRPRL